MKPAPFDYVRPGSLAEGVKALHQHGGDAQIMAGGQSLIAMLNMRLVTPRVLVDVSRIAEARHIAFQAGHVSIGCAVRQAELERWPELGCTLPLIAKALPWVGHVQTRSKGTVCGSIAHADPSSELPLCLAVLDGEVVLLSRRGRRTVRAREFFTGLMQTARLPSELIAEIRFPVARSHEGFAFNEVAVRHGDFAIVAVAAIVRRDGLTLGIGGAGDRPVVRDWPLFEESVLGDALADLANSIDMQDDIHASAAYRRHLVRELGRTTIEEARACCI